MAKVWKTLLEEYSKFDSDMVEDWRDVLLVFVSNPSCYVIQHSPTSPFRLYVSLLSSPFVAQSSKLTTSTSPK